MESSSLEPSDSPVVTWPDRPTCHDQDPHAQMFEPPSWRAPRGDDGGPYFQPHRTCSYCGSMHPEDLLIALRAGARLERTDQKYGWPHKFYVDMPNQKAGQLCKAGGGSIGGERGENGFMQPRQPTEAERADPRKVNWCQNDRGYWSYDDCSPAPARAHSKFYNAHIMDLSAAAIAELAPLIAAQTGIMFARDEKGVKYGPVSLPAASA